MAEAARRLGCSTSVIYHWIHTGQLTARRGSASRFCIPWNAQAEAGCRSRIAAVRPPGPGRPPPHAPRARVPRCRRRRDQRHRSRLPARLQHRGHLLLDRNRAAQRPPRRREPAAHPLERPDPGRMPQPHRPIRAPQPRRPAHQAPPATLRQPGMSVPPAMLTSPSPRNAGLTSTDSAPIQKHPDTRLQEGQYESSVPTVGRPGGADCGGDAAGAENWSRSSTATATGTVLGAAPMTRWPCAAAGAGRRTGCWILMSGPSSTPFRIPCC